MQRVDVLELEQVKGGVSGWTMVGIAALVVFFAGVLDGISSLKKKKKKKK